MPKSVRVAAWVRRTAPAGLLALALTAAGSAQAAITFADIGKNLEYQQTDVSGSLSPVGPGGNNAFFFGRVFYDSGNYDGGSLTINSPSPTTLPFNGFAFDCCGSTGGQYQTDYMSKPDMDAQFPTSTTYTLEVTDSSLTNPTTDLNIVLPEDLYNDVANPVFDGATFNTLNHLTAGQALTIGTSTFTPDFGAGGENFLSIFDITGNTTVYSDFGDNNRGSWAVGPGIFQAGHQYEAQLIFDSFVNGVDDGTGVPITARNDLRTDVFFDVPTPVSVPEPASWALMLLGFGALGAALRSRPRLAA